MQLDMLTGDLELLLGSWMSLVAWGWGAVAVMGELEENGSRFL